MTTWSIGVPTTSRHRHHVAGLGRPRDQRLELVERDLLGVVVGRALVGHSSVQSSSRPSAARNRRTSSSDGNTVLVAPSSVPMFAMTWRSMR